MEPVTVDQLLSWTGGSLAQPGAHPFVTSISTDSRTLAPGACFVPLAGQRFDGHQFIDEAVMKGAACIVASKDRGVAVSQDVGLILVDDTLDALWRIASGYRQLFTLPVVAITGSNGKTTTKEMVAEILSAMGPVIATEKNYNNEIGVPLTLLRIESRHRAAVVEMGMRKRGEIAQLARDRRSDHRRRHQCGAGPRGVSRLAGRRRRGKRGARRSPRSRRVRRAQRG